MLTHSKRKGVVTMRNENDMEVWDFAQCGLSGRGMCVITQFKAGRTQAHWCGSVCPEHEISPDVHRSR